MSNRLLPIGVFDSGFGGLSIYKELKKILPGEQFMYYADNKYCPYGSREPKEIIDRSERISDYFVEKGVKLIVVACNTATGIAINYLREKYSISFVGIEPAIKPAALESKTGKIGVLATRGTFEGGHFNNTRSKFAKDVELIIREGKGLVELVEEGCLQGEKAKSVLEQNLQPFIHSGIDQLVLGCTHYPFLIQEMSNILDPGIRIINPAYAVAKQVKHVLTEKKILNTETEQRDIFYTSGPSLKMDFFLQSACKTDLQSETLIL